MSQCNSEGVAEFIRLVGELEDFVDDMQPYERQFIYDNSGRIEKFGDKTIVTEIQLEFVRRLYAKTL